MAAGVSLGKEQAIPTDQVVAGQAGFGEVGTSGSEARRRGPVARMRSERSLCRAAAVADETKPVVMRPETRSISIGPSPR